MWPEGEEPRRYEWQVGSMIVPPNLWLHQHFNTGTTPARYLAFKHEVVSIRNAQGVPKAWISQRLGGDQIDYADESPKIRTMFAEALARHGLRPRMDEAYQAELAELPAEGRLNASGAAWTERNEAPTRAGMIGLGAMGLQMARHMAAKGFSVAGYDVVGRSDARAPPSIGVDGARLARRGRPATPRSSS